MRFDTSSYKRGPIDVLSCLPVLCSGLSRWAMITLMCLSTCLASGQIRDAWDKISPELLSTDQPQDILILFPSPPVLNTDGLTKPEKGRAVYRHLKSHASEAQEAVATYLQERSIPYQAYLVANVLRANLELAEIEAVARMQSVSRIIPNATIIASKPERTRASYRSAGPEWGIQMIRADSVWSLGIRGEGVVVAGCDTGYDWMHPALVGQYRGWDGAHVEHAYNWHDAIHEISLLHEDSIIAPENNPCGLNVPEPCDDQGHGTHTMGTMIGEDGENQIGVAPRAKWIACRNMERGYGSPATYLECFEWYLAPTDPSGANPDPAKAPHVINNSWSCPEMEGCNPDNFHILRQAVENLRSAGIVVVVSAGNSGSACGSISTPSSIFEASFTVGATNSSDTIAGFSSRGPVTVDSSGRIKPDVVAPGVQVRSSWLDSTYRRTSGTSMAGPHVAGTVALMISANPDLAGEVETIEDMLRQTAVPLATSQECGELAGEDVPNNTFGFGRIDALAAVEQALLFSRVKEIPEDGLVFVFPNPGTSVFNVSVPGNNGEALIRVFTTAGLPVVSKVADTFPARIDLQDAPGGLYVVVVYSGNSVFTGRIIKI